MDTSRTETIDYESLVADYGNSLATVLRGFRPGASFLETWVPDEDPAKSVLNLVEAAEAGGLDRVALFLGPGTVRRLDLPRLMQVLLALGTTEMRPENDGLVLTVSRLGDITRDAEGGQFEAVNPAYRKAVAAASSRRRHEGWLEAPEDLVRIEATCESACLAVLVDPATHIVRRAAYWNVPVPTDRGLLEILCDVITDVPIREMGDHAVLFVEYALRDHVQPRPVPGIVLPGNADPMFLLLERLVRQVIERYGVIASAQPTANFFQRPALTRWADMAPDARIAAAQDVLDELASQHGYDTSATAIRVDELARVTVRFNGPVAGPLAQHRLMQLEAGLKARLEPSLQLYLDELKDRNALRTLAVPKVTA